MNNQNLNSAEELRRVARETEAVLPVLLAEIPDFDATLISVYESENTFALQEKDCPSCLLPDRDPHAGMRGVRLRVFNADTIDTALNIQGTTTGSITRVSSNSSASRTAVSSSRSSPQKDDPDNPVCIINIAHETVPGGDWLFGGEGQEETIFYRSSLSHSLKDSLYPLKPLQAYYSPNVVLIREAVRAGHKLALSIGADRSSRTCPVISQGSPAKLPVASVISITPVRNPELFFGQAFLQEDEAFLKSKIRLALRVAAHNNHRKLVLGAIGCGGCKNPPAEVARCFLDVIRELEFRGGWFEDIVFAVLDRAANLNGALPTVGIHAGVYRSFLDVLDGKVA